MAQSYEAGRRYAVKLEADGVIVSFEGTFVGAEVADSGSPEMVFDAGRISVWVDDGRKLTTTRRRTRKSGNA